MAAALGMTRGAFENAMRTYSADEIAAIARSEPAVVNGQFSRMNKWKRR